MKKWIKDLIMSVIIASLLYMCLTKIYNNKESNNNVDNKGEIENTIITTNYVEEIPDDWQLFKQALIEVESGGNTNAVGKTGDFGIFQITPIYVAEVNRIIGEQKYSHNDALDSLKSLEMFEVMQDKYNPNKDLKKALMLHNPNAMKEHTMSYYEYKVMYNFYKLKCEWYYGNKANTR